VPNLYVRFTSPIITAQYLQLPSCIAAQINNGVNFLVYFLYSYYFILFLLFLCDFLVACFLMIRVDLNMLFVTIAKIHMLILDLCVCPSKSVCLNKST